ncbi:MAG TPA: hypothetical protein ENI44_00525, partial [Thermoplasmatales archaeon]|nr:hypothetical protein [Thermoplasmatales archaeon]
MFTSLIILYIIWKYKERKGTKFLLLLIIAALIWSTGYLLEITISNKNLIILLSKIEYIGIAIVPVAWFSFSTAYTDRFPRLTKTKLFYLLMRIPVITSILVFTNDNHNLVWSQI